MVTLGSGQDASPKGHIAIYASNDRRGSAIARAAEGCGHSSQKANTSAGVRRVLDHQRFDVGVWVVRDEAEAVDLGAALEGTKLPIHTVVVGSATALPHIKRRRGGSLRLVPSNLTAAEIATVAGACIGRGTWEEQGDADDGNHREPILLESIIEAAASANYTRAKRKQQRFSTVVSSASGHVFGTRRQLRRIFTKLIRVVIDLAPVGATIATIAHENATEWEICVTASSGDAPRRPIATTAGELSDEEEAIREISQDIRNQGGILWIDLAGSEAMSVCFTLAIPEERRHERVVDPPLEQPPAQPPRSRRATSTDVPSEVVDIGTRLFWADHSPPGRTSPGVAVEGAKGHA